MSFGRLFRWFYRPSHLLGLLILIAWVWVLAALHNRQNPSEREELSQLYPWAISTKPLEGSDWMGIYLRGKKMGYLQITTTREKNITQILQHSRMLLRIMGTSQQLNTRSQVRIDERYRIVDFLFRLQSPMSRFVASGSIAGDKLRIKLLTGTHSRTINLPYRPALISSALRPYIASQKFPPGKKLKVVLFDPQSLSYRETIIEMEGYDSLQWRGKLVRALRYKQVYRGMTIRAWIDDKGRPLKEESSTGMVLLREPPHIARTGIQDSEDLILAASIDPGGYLAKATVRKKLQLRLSNIPFHSFPALSSGRQRLHQQTLTIQREPVPLHGLPFPANKQPSSRSFRPTTKPYATPQPEEWQATPLIQSDHPAIQQQARQITRKASDRMQAIRALVAWTHASIRKKNVLGIPNALETLQKLVGDCNEHATLLAALGRAVQIPTRLVSGVAYLQGRFFYHAWNEFYLGDGQWLSADATWGQLPADVTHIAIVYGDLSKQIDLLKVIRKLKIQLLSK